MTEQNATLLAELQHRVRNVLALVTSIVGRTAETSDSIEDYQSKLLSRLTSLARTQTLLTCGSSRGVDLRDLICDELLAQVGDSEQCTISGVDLILAPKAAEVLTLAVHELTTNAVKYGAFSNTGGRLDIDWSIEEQAGKAWLHLDWSESGLTLPDGPHREGFGTQLIVGRVPYELKGVGKIVRRPSGILCSIAFPLNDGASILEAGATASATQVSGKN